MMTIDFKTPKAVALTASLICLLVYLRALACDFVNFDDTFYVLNSEAIRQLDWNLVVYAFTAPQANWVPLTHISLAIDYHFWELNPIGYHLTNILLHSANTGLVVLIADGLYRNKFSENGTVAGGKYLYPGMLLLAALVFGIHPLRVESVAWVTERKDVLNGIFSLGSIYFYLRYVDKKIERGPTSAAKRNLLISVSLFFLSLIAKTMSVTVPVLLLVIDWYPLRRVKNFKEFLQLVVEKIPYFVLSAAVAILMLSKTSKVKVLLTLDQFPFESRIIVSGNAVFEYIRLQLLPFGISPLPFIPSPIPWTYTVKTVLVLLITAGILFYWKKCRWLTAAWCCFVIALVPILALFQANPMSLAAHGTYLPSVFPGIILAALSAQTYCKFAASSSQFLGKMMLCAAVTLLVFYVAMTQLHIGVWKDSEALWTRVIKIQPFDRAYFSRALHYVDVGRYQDAIDDYTVCLRFMTVDRDPEAFNINAFRGEALAKIGRYEDAVRDFTTAIGQYPHRLYYYHRGRALKELGRTGEAEADFRQAGQAKGQMYWFGR